MYLEKGLFPSLSFFDIYVHAVLIWLNIIVKYVYSFVIVLHFSVCPYTLRATSKQRIKRRAWTYVTVTFETIDVHDMSFHRKWLHLSFF